MVLYLRRTYEVLRPEKTVSVPEAVLPLAELASSWLHEARVEIAIMAAESFLIFILLSWILQIEKRSEFAILYSCFLDFIPVFRFL